MRVRVRMRQKEEERERERAWEIEGETERENKKRIRQGLNKGYSEREGGSQSGSKTIRGTAAEVRVPVWVRARGQYSAHMCNEDENLLPTTHG